MKNILCKINAKIAKKAIFKSRLLNIFTFWKFSAFPMK